MSTIVPNAHHSSRFGPGKAQVRLVVGRVWASHVKPSPLRPFYLYIRQDRSQSKFGKIHEATTEHLHETMMGLRMVDLALQILLTAPSRTISQKHHPESSFLRCLPRFTFPTNTLSVLFAFQLQPSTMKPSHRQHQTARLSVQHLWDVYRLVSTKATLRTFLDLSLLNCALIILATDRMPLLLMVRGGVSW